MKLFIITIFYITIGGIIKQVAKRQLMKESNNQNYKWFIKADVSKYSGKWIAVEKQKIVASNEHISMILEEVNKHWPTASITKVPKRGQIMVL